VNDLRATDLGTLGTFEESVARFLARKLRRISKELTATNQKVGSSNLSGRAILPQCLKAVSNFSGVCASPGFSSLCPGFDIYELDAFDRAAPRRAIRLELRRL